MRLVVRQSRRDINTALLPKWRPEPRRISSFKLLPELPVQAGAKHELRRAECYRHASMSRMALPQYEYTGIASSQFWPSSETNRVLMVRLHIAKSRIGKIAHRYDRKATKPPAMVLSKPILRLAAASLVAAGFAHPARAQDNPAAWLTRLFQPPACRLGSSARRCNAAMERPIRRFGRSAHDGRRHPRRGRRFRQLHCRLCGRMPSGAASPAPTTSASPRDSRRT